ncbi:4-hydroxythreonine-4-phosphate dehydrogenase PdxA [Halomonas denitrificans]|nr:4-hydroxythreonine-4-phosphate dehydrogenase PdxA [Halomonas denitrificans]
MSGPVLVTPGEPAGIGPELTVRIALDRPEDGLVLVADPGLLAATARSLGLDCAVVEYEDLDPPKHRRTGDAANGRPALHCIPVPLRAPAEPGRLDPANARYVLDSLTAAVDRVVDGRAAALVTGPVHKGVINDGGFAFTGHTEFLAERAGVDRVVMMLAAGSLRVALATTHLPLRDVPAALTAESLERTLAILHADLVGRFGLPRPRILVLGLNPHAGESGHMGREEIEIIEPLLERLRRDGLDLVGPLPADTAFVPDRLEDVDAVLAMYHDQGLPVLKYAGFGRAVNITLGLPFIRTSVDHGTALDRAGTGTADAGSFNAAVDLALELVSRQKIQKKEPQMNADERG